MQTTPCVLDAQTVEGHLYALMREHGLAYVFVDRVGGHPLEEVFAGLPASQRPPDFGLRDPIFEETPDRSPALVALNFQRDGDADLLRQTVQIALTEAAADKERTVCAWVFSPAAPDHLVAALSRRLSMRYPNGKSIYLRYFDPRVMPRLQTLLHPRADHAFLTPVQTWCALGRHQQWLRFDAASPLPNAQAVHVSASMAAGIDRIELINSAARMANAAGNTWLHDRDEELDAALQKALASGLQASDQQMQYAFLAVSHGQAFTQHPSLREWIELALETDLPLTEIVQSSKAFMPTSTS